MFLFIMRYDRDHNCEIGTTQTHAGYMAPLVGSSHIFFKLSYFLSSCLILAFILSYFLLPLKYSAHILPKVGLHLSLLRHDSSSFDTFRIYSSQQIQNKKLDIRVKYFPPNCRCYFHFVFISWIKMISHIVAPTSMDRKILSMKTDSVVKVLFTEKY
jgi:hypothetical protein